jgi:5'-nucleotidase
MITRVNLTIDRATDTIQRVDARNEIVTRDGDKDAAQSAIIAKYTPFAAALATRVEGSIAADITRRTNAAGESTLGDLIADAQLADARAPERGGAAVAFTNPGGLRADLIVGHQAAGEKPGELTYSELFLAQPFGNIVTVVTLTGDQIRRILEQQFDNPSPGLTKFLPVSLGFTYTYRLNAASGSHVDAASIRVNGKIVGPADRLRVEASNFLVTGGDGFTVFREGIDQRDDDLDVDALVAYVHSHSPVAPPIGGRVTRSDRSDRERLP